MLASVNEGNRSYFGKFGKWESPQIKVFWLEINHEYREQVLARLNPTPRDKDLYEWQPEQGHLFWIDASDDRIWQIYTLASTEDAKRHLRPLYHEARGVDRLWFPETFLQGVRKSMNFDDRGFGISFRNLLTPEADRPLFSAKFWLSHLDSSAPASAAKQAFIDAGKRAFALSTVRFGRNVSSDDRGLSGQLYELYHDGHLTVTTCDETDDMLELLASIRGRYKQEVIDLEKARKRRTEVIEVEFDEPVAGASLNTLVESGSSNLRLWLHAFERSEDLTRYNGVDLHTGDFMHLDVADDYSYLSAERKACMNMAPRYGTLSSRYLSAKSRIFHDGVELFV